MVTAGLVMPNTQEPSHGAGQTRHTWNRLAEQLLTQGYHVLSVDLRGHGDSDWANNKDYSSNAFISDIKTVVDQLSVKPILVGASLGGLMSLLVVGESHLDLVKALVLVDITPNIDKEGKARIIEFMQSNAKGFANTDEAAASISAYLPHRPKPKSSKGLLRNLRLQDDGRYYWHWDPAFFGGPESTHYDLDSRNEDAARKVKVPTLLLRGQHSELVTEQAVKHLLDFIPSAMSMIQKDTSVNGLYYISPTLNEMVLKNKKMMIEKIDNSKYHTFYTPQKIQEYERLKQC